MALRRRAPRGPTFYGVYREVAPPRTPGVHRDFAVPGRRIGRHRAFTEENGKTRLTATALYPSVEMRDMVLKTGMEGALRSATTASKTS